MSIEQIDQDRCNGCRLCIDTCPVDVIRLDTFVVEREESPPCRHACPAGVDMRSYLYFLREGMIEEAIETLRETLPLPAITGRVCHHPCESECARKEVDEAVNINSLERFVADYWLKEKVKPVRKIYASKVAVIGSGPAGLSCAYFLNQMGYPVTVFEALPVLGGMLRSAIPEFRLPKNILNAQIDYIKDMGVDFKTGVTVGKDLSYEELDKNFQAVFLSNGKQKSRKLDIEGIDNEGVLFGLEFLRELNLNGKASLKKKVVVIGGGNVAIDIALAALRAGATDVQLVSLEAIDEMPAHTEEIKQAVEEGVIINESWSPQRLLGNDGKVTGVELIRCVKVYDKTGQFNPTLDQCEVKTMDADTIILAVGQSADLSMIPREINRKGENTILVDPITLETNISGTFAGGDVVGGASSVVDAIGMGKRASISIDRYLKGEDIRKGRGKRSKRVIRPPKEGIEKIPRRCAPILPTKNRTGNFKEIKLGFNWDMATLEAQRCMTCGSRAVIAYPEHCQLCNFCERDCPTNAIYVSPEKKVLPLMAWG